MPIICLWHTLFNKFCYELARPLFDWDPRAKNTFLPSTIDSPLTLYCKGNGSIHCALSQGTSHINRVCQSLDVQLHLPKKKNIDPAQSPLDITSFLWKTLEKCTATFCSIRFANVFCLDFFTTLKSQVFTSTATWARHKNHGCLDPPWWRHTTEVVVLGPRGREMLVLILDYT